jgi:Na+-translocating ferredoxin:NAD+ oxidoreductase RnfD subunit
MHQKSKKKNNKDIPGREICTLSSLILLLFSPLSLNVTILRRIYGGILDNLSMPSILVHVLVYLTTKSKMTEIATV